MYYAHLLFWLSFSQKTMKMQTSLVLAMVQECGAHLINIRYLVFSIGILSVFTRKWMIQMIIAYLSIYLSIFPLKYSEIYKITNDSAELCTYTSIGSTPQSVCWWKRATSTRSFCYGSNFVFTSWIVSVQVRSTKHMLVKASDFYGKLLLNLHQRPFRLEYLLLYLLMKLMHSVHEGIQGVVNNLLFLLFSMIITISMDENEKSF